MKITHKINHGWIPPQSPLHPETADGRYETEVDTALRRADRAHKRAIKALERAEKKLDETANPNDAKTVQAIRIEVERRYLELLEIRKLMGAPTRMAPVVVHRTGRQERLETGTYTRSKTKPQPVFPVETRRKP
jgi:hypothetical protein